MHACFQKESRVSAYMSVLINSKPLHGSQQHFTASSGITCKVWHALCIHLQCPHAPDNSLLLAQGQLPRMAVRWYKRLLSIRTSPLAWPHVEVLVGGCAGARHISYGPACMCIICEIPARCFVLATSQEDAGTLILLCPA